MTPTLPDFKALLASSRRPASRSTEDEAEAAFDIMMSGNATPSQMGGFLMALRVRGETVEEITGAVRAMRAQDDAHRSAGRRHRHLRHRRRRRRHLEHLDRGGVVVAACGVPVAKHGNRGLSSKSGAADVLAALGVNIDADMALVEQALWEANICFMMAPRHHGAMRHVAGPRVELGTRTIFNLMGPLSNPAGAKRQLTGVFSARLDRADGRGAGQARRRARLGRAWQRRARRADHHRPPYVAEWNDGKVRRSR